MRCMGEIDDTYDVCPKCGKSVYVNQKNSFLPLKTVLEERYIVGEGTEVDGEGISYVGYDKVKNQKVYIREFFPQGLCKREPDLKTVCALNSGKRSYATLLSDFLKYFRSVAKLRNISAITPVYDIFTENSTAYVIMEWIDGLKLDKYVSERGGYLPWDAARILFMPLLSSMIKMENYGLNHLGICPENMMVTPENKIKLVGFSTSDLRKMASRIPSNLYDGFSALEQYKEGYETSEVTDVYGFMAALFFALTGEVPVSAPKRMKDERLLISENLLNKIPDYVVSAIANGLKVLPSNRTDSFETLRVELSDSDVSQIKGLTESKEKFVLEMNNKEKNKSNAYGKSETRWGLISCITALAILFVALGLYMYFLGNDKNNSENSNDNTNTQSEKSDSTVISDLKTDISEIKEEKIEKITVPNLVGKNYESLQSENSSGNSKYKLVLLGEEFSESIGEGCVITQSPMAGETMNIGSKVAVTISKGSKMRIVPAVSGKTLSEASKVIVDAKFIPKQTYEYSSEYPQGIVIGYKGEVKAGDKLEYGQELTIVLSKGSV